MACRFLKKNIGDWRASSAFTPETETVGNTTKLDQTSKCYRREDKLDFCIQEPRIYR